ncbi:MAG: histidine phosphatase family protein [Ferruginibacter sp.]|nr:histidine phosphatase family protein [Ferruginibacter sp.]
MKTLIIIRHAKSSWANIGEKDFDRPLNERGKKDAPEMAEKLLTTNLKINAFVSSPAKRARKTCKAFMEVYGVEKDAIILLDELYDAPASTFYNVTANLNNNYNSIALFAHNPGISVFVNSLCKNVDIDEMPTCAVFAVQIPIEDWKDFETAEKTFLFFKYPKQG